MFGRLHPDGSISGGIKIPQLDSILAGFSADTKVTGLSSVPASDRPTATGLYRAATGWARITAVGSVALVVVAWGLAQRPYLIPTSLTVSRAAGASTTLRWLMLVTVIAVVLVGPPLVLLYRLDTRGVLQPLTDADLRQTAAGREPESP